MDHYDFKPLKGLTFWTLLMMGLRLVTLACLTYSFGSQAYYGERIDYDTAAMSDPFVAFSSIASLFYIVFWIVSGVVSLWWIYAAARNTLALRPETDITPGWAIGWFFVPIANLFKPFQYMSEIWSVSQEGRNGGKGTPLMLLWWLSYLIGNILVTIGNKLTDFQGASGGTADLFMLTVGLGLTVVATSAFAIMVRSIHRGQVMVHNEKGASTVF